MAKSNLNSPPNDESDAGHAEKHDDQDGAHDHAHGDALAGPGGIGDGVELWTAERNVD